MAKTKLVNQFSKEYFRTVSTMLTSAFSLVAALAWNDVIKRVIDRYLKSGTDVISQLIYAVIVTLLVVLVTIEMGKISEKFKEDNEA